MPKVKTDLPQTPDAKIEEAQFSFNGSWLPEIDASLIGANNYSILRNLRYKDNGLEGVNGYTKINTTALSSYPVIRNGIQLRTPNRTQETYTLVHTLDTVGGQGRLYVNKTAIPDQGDFDTSDAFDTSGNAYFEDTSTGLTGRFSNAPQGNIAYCNGEESCIWGGKETRVAGAFSIDDNSGTNPKDQTDKFNNSLQTASQVYNMLGSDQEFMMLLTVRPIQGVKFYVSSANAAVGAMTIKYWNGTTWANPSSPSDGTIVGSSTLGQTGTYSFSSTEGQVKLKHFEELYLYAYLIEIGGSVDADVYHITVDAPFQDIIDLWDGVYRQPIQFQFNNAGPFEDYTLHVNESSDINTPIGAQLDGMLSTDYIYIMFEVPMTAIKLTMLSGLVNTNASNLTVDYWDGNSFEDVSNYNDGTSNGGDTLGQTGLIRWTPPDDEQSTTLFGTTGYVYKLNVSATLSGSKGGDEEVLVDLCTGIPAQKTVNPFKFTAPYKNRLMLCNYEIGNENNRVDFCVSNAPDSWNGQDSSDHGIYSLYFGDEDPINAATQLYNRFGSNIFSMFLVMKQSSVYVMTGDDPENFTIFPVSFTIGCPAPLSLATAEVGFEVEGEVARNVAIWCSHSGPVLFDGAVLVPLNGIDNYFDPNEDNYVNTDQFSIIRGWVDSVYKEYNLLLPVGTGQTTNNTWLVYDLKRKKWFEKRTDTNELPQCGFKIVSTTGSQHIYGGVDTGYMMRLENGTSWDGVGITQKIKTGDFFPNNNLWDLTRLRKFKFAAKRIDETNTLEIFYYGDTAVVEGTGVLWADTTDFIWYDTDDVLWSGSASSSLTLNTGIETNAQRVVKIIQDLNSLGWTHAFGFEVTTTDTTKGFQPLFWGVQYLVERKDDTSTV